jgi:hypothetical protein
MKKKTFIAAMHVWHAHFLFKKFGDRKIKLEGTTAMHKRWQTCSSLAHAVGQLMKEIRPFIALLNQSEEVENQLYYGMEGVHSSPNQSNLISNRTNSSLTWC